MRVSVGSRRGAGAWAGLLALVLLAGCGGSGNDSGGLVAHPSGSADRPGFVTRYEEPAAVDRDNAAFLRVRRPMETVTEALNGFIALERPMSVVGRSCGGEGSGYDPRARRIEICYDEITEERVLFERGGHRPDDNEVVAVLVETVYHEAGHALVDLLGLAFTDRDEEDAADRFAALMLLRQGADGERQLRVAIEEYRLSAAETAAEAAAGGQGRPDEHAPDLVRAANHLCHLYGSAPDRNPDLAKSQLLAPGRAAGCGTEWARARDAWMRDLGPVLRRR